MKENKNNEYYSLKSDERELSKKKSIKEFLQHNKERENKNHKLNKYKHTLENRIKITTKFETKIDTNPKPLHSILKLKTERKLKSPNQNLEQSNKNK